MCSCTSEQRTMKNSYYIYCKALGKVSREGGKKKERPEAERSRNRWIHVHCENKKEEEEGGRERENRKKVGGSCFRAKSEQRVRPRQWRLRKKKANMNLPPIRTVFLCTWPNVTTKHGQKQQDKAEQARSWKNAKKKNEIKAKQVRFLKEKKSRSTVGRLVRFLFVSGL